MRHTHGKWRWWLVCRWDSVKIVPTPGYHLTEKPPEALQWRADAAQQPPPEPLPLAHQEGLAAEEADDKDSAGSSAGASHQIPHQVVAEAPPHRQSAASAASNAAGSGRSVRSAPPVDVLPIPAHADASPTLRYLQSS